MLKLLICCSLALCGEAFHISNWNLSDGSNGRIRRDDETPKFKLQLRNFEKDGEGKNQLVDRIKDKIEKYKEAKEANPIVGQINPSIVDYAPHSNGFIPPHRIVAPGYHNPLIHLNPIPHIHKPQVFNPYDPYHRPLLVAPIQRAALPPKAPFLHAIRDHVGHLIDKIDNKHHGPGLLNSDAISNSESQVNQINVNVRLDDRTTPHTILNHFFPWLGPIGNLAGAGVLPLVGAKNPENVATPHPDDLPVTGPPDSSDGNEDTEEYEESVTTNSPIKAEIVTPVEKQTTIANVSTTSSVNEEIANAEADPSGEEQKLIDVTPAVKSEGKAHLKTPISEDKMPAPQEDRKPVENQDKIVQKVLDDEAASKFKTIEEKKPTLLDKKKFGLLINKSKRIDLKPKIVNPEKNVMAHVTPAVDTEVIGEDKPESIIVQPPDLGQEEIRNESA